MDWATLLSDYFNNYDFIEKIIIEKGDVYTIRVHNKYLETTSIIFEIDNHNKSKIIKAYCLAFNLQTDNSIYFNKKSIDNFEIIPDSFTSVPEGEDYELEYSEENTIKLIDFINLPLKRGWKEEQFFFKEGLYKTKVYLTNSYDVERKFQQFTKGIEEDIPLPLDRIVRLIEKTFITILSVISPNHIKSKKIIVEPIFKQGVELIKENNQWEISNIENSFDKSEK